MDFKVYICGRGTTGFNENHIVEDLFNNHMCILSQSINEIRLRYTNVENVISQLLHLKKKGKQCGLSPKNTDINYEKVFISFLFFFLNTTNRSPLLYPIRCHKQILYKE